MGNLLTSSHPWHPTTQVRKPYTITKERERWTDAEHDKFLEGLKLFGRQWRKIEEHIGTKTAVQIRSHAQKFFSKLEKEAANKGGKISEDIAIPPPRPKRKPNHPYPRKAEDSSSAGTGLGTKDLGDNGLPGQMDLAAAAAAAASAALMRTSASMNLSGQFAPLPFQFPPFPGMMQWPGPFGGNTLAEHFDPEAVHKGSTRNPIEDHMAAFARISAMYQTKQGQGNYESSSAPPSDLNGKLGQSSLQAGAPDGPTPTFPSPILGPGMLAYPGSHCLSASSMPAGLEAQQAMFKTAFERWFGNTMPFMRDPSQQQAFTAATVAATNAYTTRGGAQALAGGTLGQVENNAAHAAAMAAAMVAIHQQDGQAPSSDHAKRRAERVSRLRQQKARRSFHCGSSLATSSAYDARYSNPSQRENENQSMHKDNTSEEDKANGNSNSRGQAREASPLGDSGTTNERGPKSPSPEEAVMQNRYSSHGSGSLTAMYPQNGNGSGSGSGSDGNDGNQNAPRPRHGFNENRPTRWSSQREGNGSGSGSGSDGDDTQAGGLGKRGSSDKSSFAGSGSDEETPVLGDCHASEAGFGAKTGSAEPAGPVRHGEHKAAAKVPAPQYQERKRPRLGK